MGLKELVLKKDKKKEQQILSIKIAINASNKLLHCYKIMKAYGKNQKEYQKLNILQIDITKKLI